VSEQLEATDLCCVRGDRRLFEGIGFSLGPGEVLHVTGPNGAGKTTLLRLVCGLVRPETGEVRWGGRPTRALGDDYLSRIAYLGHLNGLKDDLTARENLRHGAALAGMDADPGAVDGALARMGLAGLDGVPTGVLSQGQRRRTALARVLLTNHPVWVLDEPFTALDRAAVDTVRGALMDHLGRGGIALLTTHQEAGLEPARVRTLELGR